MEVPGMLRVRECGALIGGGCPNAGDTATGGIAGGTSLTIGDAERAAGADKIAIMAGLQPVDEGVSELRTYGTHVAFDDGSSGFIEDELQAGGFATDLAGANIWHAAGEADWGRWERNCENQNGSESQMFNTEIHISYSAQ